MLKTTLALILALTFAGIGNLMLSKGMRLLGPLEFHDPAQVFRYFVSSVQNPWVVAGIVMELGYFLAWLVVLSWADVSWAVPMNAVEYIFVAVLAKVLLGEGLDFYRWTGIFLITAGVFFMMRSWNHEREKEANHGEYH